MPTPIPDWDLPRRLVMYVGFRQINGQNPTVRATSRTLGIGRERIEKIFIEKEIVGKILTVGDVPSGEDLIYIQQVPPNLAMDACVTNYELARSFAEAENAPSGSRKLRQKRLTKKQRENLRVAEIWSERKET